jgi:hypothetical protein
MFRRLQDLSNRAAYYVDSYHVHLANVAIPVVQYVGWRQKWPLEAQGATLMGMAALSSVLHILAKNPGVPPQ